MNLPIEGLKVVMDEETEDLLYFNDRMLNDGVFIKYNAFENGEIELGQRGCIDSILEVGHLNQAEDIVLDAENFVLYWDVLLSPIQVYRMTKDIYDLYCNHTKYEFIEIIRELSTQYISASMQSNSEKCEEIIEDLKYDFELISAK